MRAAMSNDSLGPWKRIQYTGDRVSYDQPGLISSVLGYASTDAGNLGVPVSSLPATLSQSDTTSPKAIRWAVGQLTAYRPEYAWVKVRVDNAAAGITNPSGCPDLRGDTFGGDAGGTDNGKDHLWRYYEPTEVKMNLCAAVGKPATAELVKSGTVFQYPVKIYNLQDFALTNVVVRDTLGSGLTVLSSVPAQNSGPNPLVWNVGTILPGQKFEALVTVRAGVSGYLDNCVEMSSNELPPQNACDSTISGLYPFLLPSKTARTTSVAPGGTVIYDVLVRNTGTGPTGNPVTIREFLPTGFTYDATYTPVVSVNGALATASVNATNPSEPVFTVPAAIEAGKQLTIAFRANVSSQAAPGLFCNSYSVTQNGVPITTGSEACVAVGGGQIGDTVWRDWDGDGVQDAAEEGIAGVMVRLYAGDGTTLLATTTTDAAGRYLFTGLTAGNYVVEVNGGVALTGTTLTGDPDGTLDNRHAVTLTTDQQYLAADFGYQPGGAGAQGNVNNKGIIGDTVFEDVGNDGFFNAGVDTGISGVTVSLYADRNGDGVITPSTDALVRTTTTNASGVYSFTFLGEGYDYIAKVTDNDPALATYFGATPYQGSTVNPHPVDNLTGSYLNADFGYWRVQPGTIGDTVCFDANSNGLCDAGETGLPNITVTLVADQNGNGSADAGEPVITTTTSITGFYTFANLGLGNYLVSVDANDPDLPPSYLPEVESYALTLSAGQTITTADFPFTQALTKQASRASANPGDTLYYTIGLNYKGDALFDNVRIVDALPTGVTFVTATGTSPNAGGTYGPYTSLPGVPGIGEDEPTTGNSTGMSLSVTPVTAAQGGTVTVTMQLTTTQTITQVTPSLTVNGGDATCASPTPAAPQDVNAGTPRTFTFTCTPTTPGVFTFVGNADGAADYSFAEATSNSVLVSQSDSANVVTWNLGSNNPGTVGQVVSGGALPGVYAFRGGTTVFWRYGPLSANWATRASTADNVKKGGALTYDGTYIYGFRGDRKKTFYRFTIGDPGSWTTRADTSDNVDEGGALVYLKVSGTDYIFALLGNSNRFRRYSISGNSWSNMANTPATVKKGGALTTDGTYIYALQGDTKTGFWRCNATTSGSAGSCGTSWTTLTNIPANVGWGGSLTYLNDYIYALPGNNTKKFYRYGPLSGSPAWSDAPADTSGNVADGGALANDGTYIYALQGKTNGFWRYNPTTNTWAARANALGVTAQGAALVYVPGSGTVDRQTSMDATPTLVSTGTPISVTMSLLSNTGTVTNVVPSSPLTMTTSGASAVCTGPAPASQTVVSGTVATYAWNCTLTTTGNATGMITFTASATGFGGVQFAAASSESVIVVPPLTFRATVNNPPGVNTVDNLATLIDGSGALAPKPSNTTSTAVTGNIGDFVWADLDGDGVQDPGEAGLAGVQVCVTPVGGGATVCATTDALGYYRIFGLTAGTNYSVTVTPGTIPADYTATTPTTLTRTATVAGVNDADFGLRPPGVARIGDTVWIDADEDGVLDAGENGLPGITVQLYASDGTTLLATTRTDASGVYTFTGLYSNTYQVRVDTTSVVTSPYGITSTLAAAMDLVSSGGVTTTLNNPLTVVVPSDTAVVTTADFGYNWSGSIGDYVWWDNNANAAQDDGAAATVGISGAAVLLYFDANRDGILNPAEGDYQVGFTMTGANGAYLFPNLPPGPYLVDVYEDSLTTGGVRDIVPTTDNVIYKSLAAGESYLAADFGYYQGARVAGSVFHDDDRNALFGSSENGLGGITVTITGTDKFGTPVTKTTTTDAAGHFVFIVPEGDYTVAYNTAQTTAAGYGDATTVTSFTFHAYPGEDWYENTRFDFGVDYSGKIGDLVFRDVDNNGVYDPTAGESGLSGVTVQLYKAGVLAAVQATDSNGGYLFEGLAAGTYTVTVAAASLPVDYVKSNLGTADTNNNNQAEPYQVILGQGAVVRHADFGYRSTGTGGGAGLTTLRGYVYQDLTADGAYTTTDPLISGATIRVSCGVSGTFQTTTTASGIGGNWSVAGVPEGASCTVTVDTTTLPSPAYVQTGAPNPPSTGQPCVTCNSSYTLTVPAGGQTNLNFGYQQQFGGIGGTVVIGPNANGIADAGETRLQGVTITLLYAGADGILGTGDDTTTVTQTNASGTYSFTNLLPGLYQVVETNLPGYLSVADRDGGNPDNITVNLAAGQHVAGRDFEDVPPPSAAVSKTLTTPAGGVAVVGDTITFTLRITNTGVVTLTAVTITDTYDAGKLTPTGYSVTPNGQASGVLTWTTNLTPSLPLAAGAGLTLTVRFHADAITTPGVTTNTVTAAGQDVFGQRAGPLTGQATVQIQPSAAGQIGDRVWWDINGDGNQDAGEPGIAGVDLLLNGGTLTTTSAAGDYLFSPLAAGTYTVTIAPAEFQTGGTLHNWAATYPVGLVHTFTITQSQVITTADFGLNIASSYTVTKQLITPDPVRPGEAISFTLRVTNTGATWLAALPMQDAYNNAFLSYGFGGNFAQLDSDDHNNDGVLNWTDALSVTAGGPGLLAPAASTVITVWFTARADTQTEGLLGTANNVTVTVPSFDPDGAGPLPAGATQPSQGATAHVRVLNPTGLTVVNFGATAEKGKVTLTWQTANEAQLLGFNILRRVSNGPLQPVNGEIIPAEHAGANQGDRYTFSDQPAAGAYAYLLELIHLDGSRTRTNPIAVRVGP
jgi:uncharacterized repeat protein (TIGR01451 family)